MNNQGFSKRVKIWLSPFPPTAYSAAAYAASTPAGEKMGLLCVMDLISSGNFIMMDYT